MGGYAVRVPRSRRVLRGGVVTWDVAEYEVDPASAKRKASARRRAAQDPQSPQSDTE